MKQQLVTAAEQLPHRLVERCKMEPMMLRINGYSALDSLDPGAGFATSLLRHEDRAEAAPEHARPAGRIRMESA